MDRLERRLRDLVAAFGIDAVQTELSQIDRDAKRAKHPRGRPAIDDGPLLEAAARQWRAAGGNELGLPVWPFLERVAGRSATYRLYRRLRPRSVAELQRLAKWDIADLVRATGFHNSRKAEWELVWYLAANYDLAQIMGARKPTRLTKKRENPAI